MSLLRRLPCLILTLATFVKLNAEFEMGPEWARKWEADFNDWGQKFTSFTQEGRGPSPTSPGCKCRRCSLLHIDECDPKEVSSLFKFLRKRKVNYPELSENQWEQAASAVPWPVSWVFALFAAGMSWLDTEDRLSAPPMTWSATKLPWSNEFYKNCLKVIKNNRNWWEWILTRSMDECS